MADEVEGSGPLVSRRQVLGGAAVGAAVWATPAIVSLDRAAAAGSGVVTHGCAGCGVPNACDGQPACGAPGSNCFCTANVGAPGCTCTQSLPCDTLALCGAGCAPGFVCQQGCCNEPRCFPLCA